MSRSAAPRFGPGEADLNSVGQNLTNKFLKSRNQTSIESRYDYDKSAHSSQSYERTSRNSNTTGSADRGERDLWAGGGEHLSTNKLSLMLSDMQGRLKDLPTPDPSDDGVPWRTPSTDSLDASDMGSILFGQLRTDTSVSPSLFNYSETSSPGPNLDHKRVRQIRRANSEDDNDSLSSVSTASTSSYQRARRASGLSRPTATSYGGAQANGKQPATSVRRRFGDPESDYISDGASVTSLESGAKSFKSHKSSNSQKLLAESGTAGLTRLQLQQQMLQQMRPLVHQTPAAAPTATEKTPPAYESPRDKSSLPNGANNRNNRDSPMRARPSSGVDHEAPASSSESGAVAPASANGTKPRSTTPTSIPRAIPGASTPLKTANEAESDRSRAPPSAGARPQQAVSMASPAEPQKYASDFPSGIGKEKSVESTITPSAPSQTRLSGESQSISARPLPASASAPPSVSSVTTKGSPPQSAARKFEMQEEELYPARGRLRIRSASNPRTSAVEGLNRGASVAAANSPKPADSAEQRELARKMLQRSASVSVTRSDPTAGMVKASPPSVAPMARTVSESAAATYRSPPAKTAQKNNPVTPNTGNRLTNGSTTKTTPGTAGRSPVGPGASKTPPSVRQTKTSLRRQSEGAAAAAPAPAAKEVTPRRPAPPRERRFSLPTATTPITPPQTQPAAKTASSQKTPTRVNTTVVAVPTVRGLTPNRTSSSSLSTQGSGSATNSRSSTPTSTGSRSTGGRSSRPASAPTRARPSLTPVQLKSQNPFPLRNSLSPRHSLDSSPNAVQALANSPPTRGRASLNRPSSTTYSTPAISSPTMGESDHESLSSPPSQVQTQSVSKFFQPPPDAVPFVSGSSPLRFMMGMSHLGQESISGVYDSANYNPGPRHLAKSVRATPKYIMRGAEAQIAQIRASSERQPDSPPKDDTDQGSGHTDTTKASSFSTDSADAGDYGITPSAVGRGSGPVRMNLRLDE